MDQVITLTSTGLQASFSPKKGRLISLEMLKGAADGSSVLAGATHVVGSLLSRLSETDSAVLPGGRLYHTNFFTELPRAIYKNESQGSHFLTLSYKHTPSETEGSWPFPYYIRLTHQLTEDELITTMDVINEGTQDMYFGTGYHFPLSFPLPNRKAANPLPNSQETENHLLRLEGVKPTELRTYQSLEDKLYDSPIDVGQHIKDPFRRDGWWNLDPKVMDSYFWVFPELSSTNAAIFYYHAQGRYPLELRLTTIGWNGFNIISNPHEGYLGITPFTGVPIVKTKSKRDKPPLIKDTGLTLLRPQKTMSMMAILKVFRP